MSLSAKLVPMYVLEKYCCTTEKANLRLYLPFSVHPILLFKKKKLSESYYVAPPVLLAQEGVRSTPVVIP